MTIDARCQAKQVRHHFGKLCRRPAKFVIRAPYSELLVCGIHKRGWLAKVVYPIGAAATSRLPSDIPTLEGFD